MKTWKDIDIFMRKQRDGDILIMKDVDAIKNSLYNIMTTMQGSRRMLPNFALPLYNLLFEPIDSVTSNKIANTMLKAINDWDDRILVQQLKIQPKPDSGMYFITLTFRIKTLEETETLTFILNAK